MLDIEATRGARQCRCVEPGPQTYGRLVAPRGAPGDFSTCSGGKHMMITKRPTDEEAVAGGHDVPVPRVRVSVHESLLPGELSSLIGRSQLLRQGADTVGSARVLTFIGPGGVGKTRVAERLVHEMSRRRQRSRRHSACARTLPSPPRTFSSNT